MKRELNIRGIRWIDGVDLERKEVYSILKEYDFHELDLEAAMEENQRARIDTYDDYFFVILHFPKYNPKLKIYELNEFNIFVGRDFLITLRNFSWAHIDDIFEQYTKLDIDGDLSVKISSGFILYEIIQAMLEKMFKVVSNIKGDLKLLEKKIFDDIDYSLVKDIMIKKRNIIVLKNMFHPQLPVMNSLENTINKLFKGIMELYFEDLEDKLGFIIDDINILNEQIETLEDAFKTMIDIKTTYVVRILTIFSTFLLPLTFITSFYGMNIDLPYQENPLIIFWMILGAAALMLTLYYYFEKRRKL